MFYKYGRINRATYLLSLAIMVAIYALAIGFMTRPPRVAEILALLIAVPRLHDIGKSGWWAGAVILAELAVVFIALPFAISAKQIDILLIAGGLFVFAVLGLMIVLGCIRGQDGVNKYGEAPPPGISFKTYRMTKSAAEAEAEAF
jgi:uncharacterized membrane protein YhaH (DUF805 family)